MEDYKFLAAYKLKATVSENNKLDGICTGFFPTVNWYTYMYMYNVYVQYMYIYMYVFM